MNLLILDESKQAELEELNATGHPLRQLQAAPLNSGDAALSASLLTDCGEADTWGHYGEFLEALPAAEISPEQLVEEEIS